MPQILPAVFTVFLLITFCLLSAASLRYRCPKWGMSRRLNSEGKQGTLFSALIANGLEPALPLAVTFGPSLKLPSFPLCPVLARMGSTVSLPTALNTRATRHFCKCFP